MLSTHKQVPIFTIIVAVFNGRETLKRCLESFIHQTYPEKELIVIDGGSDDGSVEIIQAYQDQITYWESQPDRGLAHAWNKALDKAAGDWIYFLGCDDYLWSNDTLELVANFIQEISEPVKLIHGKVVRFLPNGELLDTQGQPWQEMQKKFMNLMAIHHQSVFQHKSLFEDYSYFDESFRLTCDYELLLRSLKQENPVFINEVIAGVFLGGMANRAMNRLKFFREISRAIKKLDAPVSPLLLVFCYIRIYIRMTLTIILGEETTDKFSFFILKLGNHLPR